MIDEHLASSMPRDPARFRPLLPVELETPGGDQVVVMEGDPIRASLASQVLASTPADRGEPLPRTGPRLPTVHKPKLELVL